MKATRTHSAPGEKKFVPRVDAIAVMVANVFPLGRRFQKDTEGLI